MNISIFDQTRKDERNSYGEAVRLSNELRYQPAKTYIDEFGFRVDISERWGFNCETAPYSDFVKWLNDNSIKKSKSLFWFVIRIMAWRFPEKHTAIKNSLSENRKLEFDLILSQMKKEYEWCGLTGYQNQVELNSDSLSNKKNIRIIKGNNDTYKTIRI